MSRTVFTLMSSFAFFAASSICAKTMLSSNQVALDFKDMSASNTSSHPVARHFVAVSRQQFPMASSLGPVGRLAARPHIVSAVLRQSTTSPFLRATATSQFHTSRARNATPSGPPPKGFRLPRPQRFDEGESSINKASNYFLMTEMFRGMYVVLEQYFRPP